MHSVEFAETIEQLADRRHGGELSVEGTVVTPLKGECGGLVWNGTITRLYRANLPVCFWKNNVEISPDPNRLHSTQQTWPSVQCSIIRINYLDR